MARNPISYRSSLLMLALAGAAAGALYGWLKDERRIPGSLSGKPTVGTSRAPTTASRAVSAMEFRQIFLANPDLLDAQLSLGRWIETASSEEIGKLLWSLAIGSMQPGFNWIHQAELVASLWAAKDPTAAISFVSSHHVHRDVAREAGITWALDDPDAAAQWLRDQSSLTKGECAGMVCGLSISNPDLAREFVSRPGEIYGADLSEIGSKIWRHGVEYFVNWVNGVENETNRKDLVLQRIVKEDSIQESVKIINKLTDRSLREKCYAIASRNLDPVEAAQFLESVPAAERAFAVTGLVCRSSGEAGEEQAADLMKRLPQEEKERAIARLLNEEEPDSSDTLESIKQRRLEMLETLVPDPEERKKIISNLADDVPLK